MLLINNDKQKTDGHPISYPNLDNFLLYGKLLLCIDRMFHAGYNNLDFWCGA